MVAILVGKTKQNAFSTRYSGIEKQLLHGILLNRLDILGVCFHRTKLQKAIFAHRKVI